MTQPSEMTFGAMLRHLRNRSKLKAREFADLMEISASTLGNAECGPYQVLGVKRVEALIVALGLDSTTAAMLRELHAASPASPFQAAQRERWAKAKEGRAALKEAKALTSDLALAVAARDVLARRETVIRGACIDLAYSFIEREEAEACTCYAAKEATEDEPALDAEVCCLCLALEALGLSRYVPDVSLEQLGALQDPRTGSAAPASEPVAVADDFG